MANDHDAGVSCPACGQTNDANARFCNSCGHRIDSVCPSCGAENPAGSRFCNQCGHGLAASVQSATEEPAAAEAAPPEEPVAAAPTAAGAVCPRCQHINEPRSQRCSNCGLPLKDETESWPDPSREIPAYATSAPGGFWLRFVALFIDIVILTGAAAILVPIVFDESIADETLSAGARLFNSTVSVGYFTLLVGIWGATLGKSLLGMRIVRPDGSPVGIWRALGRQLATIPSFIFLLIGYLMVAFRSDKRALHDLIADTVVIRVRS